MPRLSRCVLAVALLTLLCRGPRHSTPDLPLGGDLARWVAITPYGDTSSEMLCARESREEWHVYKTGDTVRVRPTVSSDRWSPPPFRDSAAVSPSTFLGIGRPAKVTNGWLVGYDLGEFGGSVWWFSADGRDSAKVSDGQVSAFFKVRDFLVATGGLAHMGSDEGRILRLTQDSAGRWRAVSILDLGDSPEAPVKESDSALLIVGARRLTRVVFSDVSSPVKAESLASRNWGFLYPNSAVRTPSGTVYVGMRHAVMRLVPDHSRYIETWLVPPACRTVATDSAVIGGHTVLPTCRCTARDTIPR
jgi:hypothetical protein